jgi:hypothetical protein
MLKVWIVPTALDCKTYVVALISDTGAGGIDLGKYRQGGAAGACRKAAAKLREAARRFDLLALEPNPVSQHSQSKANRRAKAQP